MFSLESPHRGDSNEYTQYTITKNYHKYDNVRSYGFFLLGTQERVRNSRGKRAIGVRATEVLPYFVLGGFERSTGIMYQQFLGRFNNSAAATAWVTSIFSTLRLILGKIFRAYR